MEFIDKKLSQYAEQHTTPENELLKSLNRDTHANVLDCPNLQPSRVCTKRPQREPSPLPLSHASTPRYCPPKARACGS